MQFSLPIFKKEKKRELYLGLFIREHDITGFAFEKTGDHIRKITEENLSINGWDALVENVDDLLFRIESRLHEKLTEVIFFVHSYVIDEDSKNIRKEYISLFKNIVKQLELKALGYIECHEAIAHYLGKKDESPLTGVLIEFDTSHLGVFVYKGAQKVLHKVVDRKGEIVADLKNIFGGLVGDILLPSRMILYDTEHFHNEATQIMSHSWEDGLFAHHPKTETLRQYELHEGLFSVFEGQVAHVEPHEPTVETHDKKEVMGFIIGADVPPQERTIRMPSPAQLPIASFVSFLKLGSQKLGGIWPGRGGVTIAAALGVVFLVLLSVEYFVHKVSVDVLFPSRTIGKTVAYADSLDGKVTIKPTIVSLDLQEKKSTTGKREIGEEAKGEVILNNFDEKERIITKGTVLETASIKFMLDADAKIASYSATTIDGKPARLPGQAKGKVTAVEIGPEGNIPKGKNFKVGEFANSLIFAMNENPFTGGSKKQVKTVAKQDIDSLQAKLLSKAKEQAEKDFNASSSGEVLGALTSSELEKVKSSKEVGEEANEVNVQAKVNTVFFTYSPQDVKRYLKDNFTDKLPQGYKLDENNISYEIKDAKKNDKTIDMTLESKALLLKDVSTDDVISQIKGKKRTSVEKILKEKFQATGADIKYKPNLPLLNSWMPFFKKNIELTVSSL